MAFKDDDNPLICSQAVRQLSHPPPPAPNVPALACNSGMILCELELVISGKSHIPTRL